jgi:NADP-dependent 3-hydroxy acid dehydrogenase YdfG
MTQIGSPTETTSLPLAELSEKEWDYSIDLNLKTAFNITKAVLHCMLASYGQIVNVSSLTALSSATLAKPLTVRRKPAWLR